MFIGYVYIPTVGEFAGLKNIETGEKRSLSPGQRIDILVAKGVWSEGCYAPIFSVLAKSGVDEHHWQSLNASNVFCGLVSGMKVRLWDEIVS